MEKAPARQGQQGTLSTYELAQEPSWVRQYDIGMAWQIVAVVVVGRFMR
jgi:hypothetical protein